MTFGWARNSIDPASAPPFGMAAKRQLSTHGKMMQVADLIHRPEMVLLRCCAVVDRNRVDVSRDRRHRTVIGARIMDIGANSGGCLDLRLAVACRRKIKLEGIACCRDKRVSVRIGYRAGLALTRVGRLTGWRLCRVARYGVQCR